MGSCLKQDTPEVNSDYQRPEEDQRRVEACSDFTIVRDILNHKNMIDLMSCTNWRAKFPHLFDALTKIAPEKWNYLFSPINDNYYNKPEIRDRFIQDIRELDERNALDDLGNVITALNDTNFYDSIVDVFQCASGECARAGIQLTREEIETVFGAVDFRSESLLNMAKSVNALAALIAPREKELQSSIRKFYEKEAFGSLRNQLSDEFVSIFESGLEEDERRMIGEFIWKSGDENLFKIKESAEFNVVSYQQYINLITSVDYKVPEDYHVLNQILENRPVLKCADDLNLISDINLSQKIESLTINYVELKNSQFERNLLRELFFFKSAEKICPSIVDLEGRIPSWGGNHPSFLSHKLKFDRSISQLANTLKFKFYESLIRQFLTKERIFSNFKFPLRFFGSRLSLIFLEVLKFIKIESPEYFEIIYGMVSDLTESDVITADLVIEAIEQDLSDSKMKALVKYWGFLTLEERNYLFRFLDKHIAEEANLGALLRFYASQLALLSQDYDNLMNSYFPLGDTKQFADSVEELSIHLSGAKVLSDFKAFFSRGHIIEVMKIISRGINTNDSLPSDLSFRVNASPYITTDEQAVDSRYSDCLETIYRGGQDVYGLLEDFPQVCRFQGNDQSILQIINWTEETRAADGLSRFFSDIGFFSASRVHEFIRNLKKVILWRDDGISSAFKKFKHYLFETKTGGKGLASVLGSLGQAFTRSLVQVTQGVEEFSLATLKYYRSGELKETSSSLFHFFRYFALGSVEKPFRFKINRKQIRTCKSDLNQKVGYQCPEDVRNLTREINRAVPFLLRNQEGKENTLYYFIKAFSKGQGIAIPINSADGIPYRLTFTETFSLLNDLSDQSKAVNQISIPYQDVKGRTSVEKLTTLERIDVVIRDVRFGMNYLGVQYMNSVAHGDDYNDDVKNRKKLLATCLRIPVVRCGKKITKSEIVLAKNALEAYDGLLDVNNGRSLDDSLNYDSWMKVLLGAFILSSSEEAQKVQLLPLEDSVLEEHNGQLLGYFSSMSLLSHSARVLRDRIERDGVTLGEFINHRDIKLIDDNLTRGINPKVTADVLSQMLEVMYVTKGIKGENLLADLVIWLDSLTYQEVQTVEHWIARATVVLSSLGSVQSFSEYLSEAEKEQYGNLGLSPLINSIPVITNLLPSLYSSFQGSDFSLIKFFQKTEPLIEALYQYKKVEPKKFFLLVNRGYNLAIKAFLAPESQNHFSSLISSFLVLEKYSIFEPISLVFDYFSHLLDTEDIAAAIDLTGFLVDFSEDESYSLEKAVDYLLLTSSQKIIDKSGSTVTNPHYRELEKFLGFWFSSDSKKTNFEKDLESIFVKNIESSSQFMEDAIDALLPR